MVLLSCLVHPIDTAAHPTVPPGWRWAVMVGQGAAGDLSRCANAGWCPSAATAEQEGDQNAATATRVLHILGVPASYGGVFHLDHDPIPAGGDRLHVA
jgi:hypothetical protein